MAAEQQSVYHMQRQDKQLSKRGVHSHHKMKTLSGETRSVRIICTQAVKHAHANSLDAITS